MLDVSLTQNLVVERVANPVGIFLEKELLTRCEITTWTNLQHAKEFFFFLCVFHLNGDRLAKDRDEQRLVFNECFVSQLDGRKWQTDRRSDVSSIA